MRRNDRETCKQLAFRLFFLLTLVFLNIAPATECSAQDNDEDTNLTSNLGIYLVIYKINVVGDKPALFEDFMQFELETLPEQDVEHPGKDESGNTIIGGEVKLRDGTILKLKKAIIRVRASGEYEYLNFETETNKNISYKFAGKFLEESIRENKIYISLRGTLKKYENGRKVAKSKFSFYRATNLDD